LTQDKKTLINVLSDGKIHIYSTNDVSKTVDVVITNLSIEKITMDL